MRRVLLPTTIGLLVARLLVAQELQTIPADAARAYGEMGVKLAEKLDNPQIKIVADVSKASGVHVPDMLGLLLVPQKDLREGPELVAQFKAEKGAPLAYVFAYKILPLVDGKPVDAKRLPSIKVKDDQGNEHAVHVLLLSVRQAAEDDYRLYGFGKDAKPIVDAKFTQGDDSGSGPVTIEIKEPDESARQGTVVVTVFGKYRASFRAAHVAD